MDLETYIIMVFCWVDDQLRTYTRLRWRGPHPILDDSEVITMTLVGEFLRKDTDTEIFRYFRHHWRHFFPAVARIDRTTFARQAANLMGVTTRLYRDLVASIPLDGHPLWRVDSVPLPVCRYARARGCRRFPGLIAWGRDETAKQPFRGFRGHLCIDDHGLIRAFVLAPTDKSDLAALPELVEAYPGIVIGDRNYWSPDTTEELHRQDVTLWAPYKNIKRDPNPRWSSLLGRARRIIETVLGQLVERFRLKTFRARDQWHLSARMGRKLLSHTIAVWSNLTSGQPPLHLEAIISS